MPGPSLRERFLSWWRHAFAIEAYDETSLAGEEQQALKRLAAQIVQRRMGTAAILFLQSNRHMNFLGSQVLVAAEPLYDMGHQFLRPLLARLGLYVEPEEMPLLIAAFEKRFSIEYLIQCIEAGDAEARSLPAEAGQREH